MLPQNLPLSLSSSSRIIVNRYAVSKKIGNGTFGTVYLVEDNFKNQAKKVLKEICIGDMNEQETQSVDREANLLSKLNHHNIVRMFESFVNEESFYIVMEYCQMGDLDRELKTWQKKKELVPMKQILDWLVQLIMAVQYIHSQKMLHRDLKCKNVFLSENKTVKIGDFGISRILTSTEYASTFTGTPYYMSPEVIKHDGYGSKSDIWSLGVILYEMCELKRAFDGKNLMSVMMKIIQGHLPALSKERGQLGPIFRMMLRQDPHERPSSSQLLSEPLIARHVHVLRKRLASKKKRVNSASSQTSVEKDDRRMTARERMRFDKQRRADEEAEQLRHAASENLAANRARTAARKHRESNRPDIIKQGSPSLEIKAINPNVIRHDRDFCYSPKSQSPSSRRPITAIHPEPRKRLSSPRITLIKNDVDRQLEAIENSLEYAKAESLSKAIRLNQGATAVEVDGGDVVGDSDQDEIMENTPNSGTSSNSTIDKDIARDVTSTDDPLRTAKVGLAATGASLAEHIPTTHTDGYLGNGTTLSSSSSVESIEEAILFETADEECLIDVSNLELTTQIPENEEDANTFYSLEDFEEEPPEVPGRQELPASGSGEKSLDEPERRRELAKARSVSLDLEGQREVSDALNRSLPTSTANKVALLRDTDLTDGYVLDLSNRSELDISYNSAGSPPPLNISSVSELSDLNISNVSGASNHTDYTKSSTVILRSDRIRTLRSRCETRLGATLFGRIYGYLEEARYGDHLVPEEDIVGTLKNWVPELTSDCFLVDQLIYLEKQELLAREAVTECL